MSRWNDLAVWRPTAAHGGPMKEHRGLVLHIAEGYYQGTIDWQQNPRNKVSSHFVAGRDPGELAQLVDTEETAWTQRAGNGHWLSLECAGFTRSNPLHANHPGWEQLSAWQIECAAQLLVREHKAHGVPLQLATTSGSRGLGHHSMGGPAWGHLSCPGDPIIMQKHAILARALQLTGKKPPAPTPAPGKGDIMSQLPVLKSGATGTPVKRVQALANLTLGGGDVAVDGAFGPRTVAIVQRVQASAHLAQDGVVGPKTWAVLLGVAP